MRLLRPVSNNKPAPENNELSSWITYTAPAIRTSDLGPLVMIVAVFMGFLFAIHYAESPKLFAGVERINRWLNPILTAKSPAPVIESEALVVTQDKMAELTTIATLGPRGFRPVLAASAQDALTLLSDRNRTWKLAVIDSSIPQFAMLPDALKTRMPDRNVIMVEGKKGSQAVSRTVLERLESM